MTTSRKHPPRPALVRREADPWMSVRQAAEALGIHPQTVKGRAAEGRLVTQVVAGRLFVRRDSVDELRATHAA